MAQDHAWFWLQDKDEKVRLRFHDYAQIYSRPGLYEQVFYDRLKCNSPQVVADILERAVLAVGQSLTELRLLDFGAGNGMMGEILARKGVSRTVGVDIIPEARDAATRDRPGVYDDYVVADMNEVSPGVRETLDSWRLDLLTCVAALGFGDIPPSAFFHALSFVHEGGWVALNIRETFLDHTDTSGFSRLIREIIFSEYLEIHHLQRYRHRLSMDGQPLFYFALVGRKLKQVPYSMLERLELTTSGRVPSA